LHFLLLFILVFLSILLQTTVFDFFQVAGVKPDLVLLIVIIYGLVKGPKAGAIVGFFSGLLVDLTMGSFIGLNALVKMITGYMIGFGETKVFKENLIIPILAVFTASLFNEFLLYLLHTAFGYQGDIFSVISRNIVPVAIYNTVLVPIIYAPFYRYLLKRE